jgi:hypothetical protein
VFILPDFTAAAPLPVVSAPPDRASAVITDTRGGGVADWPRVRSWLAPGAWLAGIADPGTLPEFAGRLLHAGFVVADTIRHTAGPLVVLAHGPGRARPLGVDASGRYPANVLDWPGARGRSADVPPDELPGWLARLLVRPGGLVVDPLGTTPAVALGVRRAGRQAVVVVPESRKLLTIGYFLLTLSGSRLE